MKKIPDFDVELAQAIDYIMDSQLAKKAFIEPPFHDYTNILRYILQCVDRLADNCHIPEFTNHAMPHICSIVRRASEWAEKDGWLEKISSKEAGYLVIALVIHDIGMLSQEASDIPSQSKMQYLKGFSDISNWVRRTHVIRVKGLVERMLSESILKEKNDIQNHLNVIFCMAESHQKWPWEKSFISYEDDINELGLK